MENELVLANPVGICRFGCSKIECINGRALMLACYKLNKIVADEQGFELSSPLWKSGGNEFFIDGCGSIDCDDG